MKPLCILSIFGRIFIASSFSINDGQKNAHEADWSSLESMPKHYENYEYKPVWSSLDKRPLPEWYDKAKIGILVHWGVFSVPSLHSEWFGKVWEKNSAIDKFMKRYFPHQFTYQDFGPMFRAEFYHPKSWAELFSEAGAKYVILTSKHHDGFTLFRSRHTPDLKWNSVEVGPKRDLIRPLAEAVRAEGLKFGLYHSLYEWNNPKYLEDKSKGFSTRAYTNSKLLPDLGQIVHYYKPSVIWCDGDWEANETYWRSQEFLAWLYSESPVKDEVVVNDRWGAGKYCRHGDFYTCAEPHKHGALKNHKWEKAFSLDKKSWGYRRDMKLEDVMTFPELLKEVVSTVSRGGNALINVGATKEGTIALVFQERLLSLGEWLKRNGEAIYESSPWIHHNESAYNNSNIWYTCLKSNFNPIAPNELPNQQSLIAIYVIILEKKLKSNTVKLNNIAGLLRSGQYGVQLLGNSKYLEFNVIKNEAFITMPPYYPEYPVLNLIQNVL